MTSFDIDKLLAAAAAARERAYAPYSLFSVGAAALADDGNVYAATNVENASYGLSMCAERAAIAAAVAGGATEIKAIAVVAARPSPPCGACLQVIAELGPHATIAWGRGTGTYEVAKVSELLPKPFRLERNDGT
jgi:cytidine deaminase